MLGRANRLFERLDSRRKVQIWDIPAVNIRPNGGSPTRKCKGRIESVSELYIDCFVVSQSCGDRLDIDITVGGGGKCN